jgi:hypothetical protein
MSKYKILWIDDKWKDMDSFKDLCELPKNDIEVVSCTNAEEGMEIFEAHLEEWSGVILDAKVFKGKGDEVDRLAGLTYSLDRINELKHKRNVPYYIFTGQPDTASGTTFADQYEGKYYEKDKDENKLIADIKRNADELKDTQIIHKPQAVFDVWPESRSELLRLFKVMEAEDWKDNSFFVVIRKVLSDVMSRLYKCGYCSVEHDGSNLGDCSRALGLPNMSDIIPVYIQRSLHTCVEVTNPGCHRTECDSAVKEGRAPYLIRSLVFDLLNILYWCKDLPPEIDREKTAQRVKQSMEEFDRKKEESQNRKRQRYIQQD